MGNSALLERGDELGGEAEPGNGELILVPLHDGGPLLVAPVPVLNLVFAAGAEPEALEGMLNEHEVWRRDGRGGARPPTAERPAAEGSAEPEHGREAAAGAGEGEGRERDVGLREIRSWLRAGGGRRISPE